METENFVDIINITLSKVKSKLGNDTQNLQPIQKKRKISNNTIDEHNSVESSSVQNEENEPIGPVNPKKKHDTAFCTTSELAEILLSEILSPWERNVFNEALTDFHLEKNTKDSIIKCHALLHSLWQKLHTGHWSQVPIELRAAFTLGSIILVGFLLKELREDIKVTAELSSFIQVRSSKVVLMCDRGLMMGKPVNNNPLHLVAFSFNKFAMTGSDMFKDETIPLKCPNDFIPEEASPFSNMAPIESQVLPSLQDFLLNNMQKKKPLKILGIADNWPAMQNWNFKYFCEVAGARTVPVEIGLRYTDSDWSQVLMTINQYMNTCTNSQGETGKKAYLAQHQLFDQIPELLSDIMTPDYCHMGERDPVMNAWIGPQGTVTPLHHDPDHNILVQVYGYKIILIYPECDSEYLYPYDDELLNNTSKVNLEEVTKRKDVFEEWPLLKNVKGHYLVLGPGDALYIPPKWWHYVRSLSNSISVSFWWR